MAGRGGAGAESAHAPCPVCNQPLDRDKNDLGAPRHATRTRACACARLAIRGADAATLRTAAHHATLAVSITCSRSKDGCDAAQVYHGACLAPLYDIVWKKNKGGGTKDNRAVMTAVEALRFTGAC